MRPLTCGCPPPIHIKGCAAAPALPASQHVVDFARLIGTANSGVGVRFIAAFTSRDGCPECGGLMEEGDEVGWVDDVVVCGDCHTIAQE